MTPPSLPRGAIVRPEFDTAEGRISAGTAFFAAIPGQAGPLGLTAHHLFGTAGGLEREVSATELGQLVRAVYFSGIDAGEEGLQRAGSMVVLPSAGHSQEAGDWSTDVAAFRAPASFSPRALRLAPRNAAPGEDVWLVAEVLGGTSAGQHLHRARVVHSKPMLLAYQFEDTTLELRATSGAPVVNARGEVVGLQVSGGPDGDVLWGNAHPVESLRAHLMRGLSAAE
ncbi:trypsin-like peptidase domain-containing protein [Sorangium sp. So ce1014]|uniref:trypsin-like peptidase domain-containing protein n=1 Tax=Sorangium sp. So ce1014 TaxID=3133326 RepID=UPI003F6080E5